MPLKKKKKKLKIWESRSQVVSNSNRF